MEYYFSTSLHCSFDEAIARTIEALKVEGFGVITEINMQAKLKEKLGVDFKKYVILGACNPAFAYKALQIEDKIGTMLPCNIIVTEKEEGIIEVSAVNPIASMMAIQNSLLEPLALEITTKIKRVINLLK